MSVYALQYLANAGVNIICCDDKFMPACTVIPLNKHYRLYGVLKKQLALTKDFQDLLWQQIIKGKINNQRIVSSIVGINSKVVERLQQLADEVLPGDIGNREGIAAKMYFRSLYGFEFLRFSEDIINYALNFGYITIRAAVARSLTAYGYNCVLGLHHINENNGFNLADDIMEPVRPWVDLWVYENNDSLVDVLSKQNKLGLVNLLNAEALCGGKVMRLHNALDKYIASLTTAIDSSNANKLLMPSLIDG